MEAVQSEAVPAEILDKKEKSQIKSTEDGSNIAAESEDSKSTPQEVGVEENNKTTKMEIVQQESVSANIISNLEDPKATSTEAGPDIAIESIANAKTTPPPEVVEGNDKTEAKQVEEGINSDAPDGNARTQPESQVVLSPYSEEQFLGNESMSIDLPMEHDSQLEQLEQFTVNTTNEMECETTATASETSVIAPNTSNGLSLLAAYSSDGDSDGERVIHVKDSNNDDDDVVEVPVTTTIVSSGRRPIVHVSSDSDSSSSSSDSDSEGEYLTALRNKIEKRINTEVLDDDDDDDDEENARPRRRQPPKVRGEMLLDELPPIDQLEITVPEDECIELGKVQSIVDQLVLVSVLPNSMLFDLETVLFLEKGRKVLGQVFDVLGQVADPLYCVRFNSNQQIKDQGINVGDIVYCAPQTEHTQFVILSKLMQVRGSDASWEHDVEPPARFIDYSDDEAERDARLEQRKRRQRERTNSTDSVETTTTVASVPSEAVAPQRQRGRRAQREYRHSHNYSNGGQQQQLNQQNQQNQQNQSRSQSRDSQYNYHPSYNPGSWHSNYYHNYHPPPANFNMMPGATFPMPTQGYGYMPPPHPPPHPYAMPPPHSMQMGMPPPHMYPPQQPPPYGPPQRPPQSGS